MQIIDLLRKMFEGLYTQAVDRYHVNPGIFIFLYVISFIPYYVGVYQMATALIKQDGRRLMQGAAINRFGWALPYLYILIFGQNLPLWVVIGLVALLAAEVAVGFNKRRQKRIVKVSNNLLGAFAGVLLKIIPAKIRPIRPAEVPAALKLEYQVFRALGYTERSQEHQIDDYVKYLDQSTFFVAMWCGKLIGVLRLIHTGKYEPPVLSQFEINSAHAGYGQRADFEEVGIVAVSSLFINAEVGKLLYRAAWQDAQRRGVKLWGAVIEKWLLDLFNKRYHFPFKQFGKERYYMGAVVYPVVMDLDEATKIYEHDYPEEFAWFKQPV